MPHLRKRYVQPLLEKALRHSPIAGLLGQRQTGKTTLVSALSGEYVTLDKTKLLQQALSDPEAFIASRREPFAIDECQLAPALFPELKDSVRVKPRKGRFILTGSVRFTSRKAIRESLTGRIFNLELLPLSLSESSGLPLSDLPLALLKGSDRMIEDCLLKRARGKLFSDIPGFLSTGGLPGICFVRDRHIRGQKFDTHVETLIERDLRLLIETSVPFSTLLGLLEALALRQGSPLDLSEVSRVSRISRPTLNRLLPAFESMFLLRKIHTRGGRVRPVFMFEDQGTATWLARGRYDEIMDLYRVMYANIFPQFHYRPELNAKCFHYLTRGGAWVPLVFETQLGTIGYVPEMDSEAQPSSIASARSFQKIHKEGTVVIAHQGSEVRRLSEYIYSIPVRKCF